MMADLVWFCFMGCIIFAVATLVFFILMLLSPVLRREVLEDWRTERSGNEHHGRSFHD